MNETALLRQIDALASQMVRDRRDLHHYAEAGWVEFRTTSKIVERLEALDIPVLLGTAILSPEAVMGRPDARELARQEQRAVSQGARPDILSRMGGYTGAVGLIETGRPGSVVALRFEIDSNDANETSDPAHRPNAEGFASVNPGFQHACGHDGHTAVGLCCAELLQRARQQLCGTIKLFFQPAEEGVRGAAAMAASGLLDDVDWYMSGHIVPEPVGTLFCGSYGMLATKKFDAEFTGRSAHAGASPQEGKNALLAAASATLALHSLCQDSRGAARVNVGVLQAGTGRNVVPDHALMKLETRGDTNEISEELFARAQAILRGAGEMYGVSLAVQMTGAAPGAHSDPEAVALVRRAAEENALAATLHDLRKVNGSDDTSAMMLAVQRHGGKASHLMWGGSLVAPGHNSYFDFDETVLPLAAKSLCLPVCRLLSLA